MFLSRIEIPWEAARNSYEIHRRIWRLFPGEERESRKAGIENRQGFLFRVEDKQTGRPASVLVQSRRTPQPEVHPPLGFRKANYAGKLSTVTYEGALTVVDPQVLTFHLENGVGPAKAFGCGLLIVRRVG